MRDGRSRLCLVRESCDRGLGCWWNARPGIKGAACPARRGGWPSPACRTAARGSARGRPGPPPKVATLHRVVRRWPTLEGLIIDQDGKNDGSFPLASSASSRLPVLYLQFRILGALFHVNLPRDRVRTVPCKSWFRYVPYIQGRLNIHPIGVSASWAGPPEIIPNRRST